MSDIEVVVRDVLAKLPETAVEQLRVLHPGADDDGLWFFRGAGGYEVQLESPTGNVPFLVEHNGSSDRARTVTIQETVALVVGLLSSPGPVA